MVGDNFRLGDFIERTLVVPDTAGLLVELKQALRHWGFSHLACCSLGDGDKDGIDVIDIDYPQEWQQHYFDHNYVAIDPTVTRAAQARIPYRWDQLGELTPAQRRFFAEAGEAGLRHGITLPIHGPAGEVFIASVASGEDGIDHLRGLSVANILITQAYSVLVRLKNPGPPGAPVALTGRERECLIWSARGKSSWDIGVILNISENTVNFHLKNAMSKLKTSTRVLAIVKAIRMGLIVP